jgi:hypothetical protein
MLSKMTRGKKERLIIPEGHAKLGKLFKLKKSFIRCG